MTFMEMDILKKGKLYSAECGYCGVAMHVHEWASADPNEERDALQAGTMPCSHCAVGRADPATFHEHARPHYAGRYSAPGYLDCTDWEYDTNLRRLRRTLRETYG